jgi:hypothetical protein
MQPMNYITDVQQPFQAGLSGIQSGISLSGAIDQNAERQQALQQKQFALQQQQQLSSDLNNLYNKPDKTTEDYINVATRNPALAEHMKSLIGMRSSSENEAAINNVTPVFAALTKGKVSAAKAVLNQQLEAANNSGNQAAAQGSSTMLKLIDTDPEMAKTAMGIKLSAALGPDKFAENFGGLTLNPSKVATSQAEATKAAAEAAKAPEIVQAGLNKTNSEAGNLSSEALYRAKQFGLNVDEFNTATGLKVAEMQQKNGQLPEFVAKDVNEAASNAIAAQQSADKMDNLAVRLEKASISGGVAANVSEVWKKTFATQGELTRMRAEYNRIVTPAAMSQYKKVATGSTSDKDIDTAMTGVPKDTDNQETMVSFLRGAAKLQRIDSIMNNAKSEWLGSVRDLGKSKTDVTIDGVKVPAGTTFKQFTDNYVNQKYDASQTQAAQQPAALQQRSYMVHAGGGQ